MHNTDPIQLNGKQLSPTEVELIATGAPVALSDDGLQLMARAREIIESAATNKQAIYGVTTGLGPKVVESLPQNASQRFSLTTIRGRAHAVGDALPEQWVRAGMAVRVNSLLSGAPGARPALAEHIAQCLNQQITPLIPETGTIGVADLNWGGAFGRVMIGEGKVLNKDGTAGDAATALQKAGIAPYSPALREGLAMVSHSCFTGGICALASCELKRSFAATQIASALSMEGFRANISPLDKRALKIRPQAGQQAAADQLLTLLKGSSLLEPHNARRLQDPLSIRNIPQVHGCVQATLKALTLAVVDEINGASDNPAVLADDAEVISHGGYLPVYLCIALNSALQAFVHLAALQVSRLSKLMFERFSGLNNGLTAVGTDGAGLAPLIKTAESLFAEIAHLAHPAPVYPGLSADGLEDVVTHTAIPAKAAFAITSRLNRLAACELLVALQAIDLRGVESSLSPVLTQHYETLRKLVPVIEDDRPLGDDIEVLAALIEQGRLAL